MPKGVYTRKSKVNSGKYAVGTVHTTNQGDLKVIERYDDRTVIARFLNTDYVTKCRTSNIASNKVKNHRLPSVYGVGYLDGIKLQPRGTYLRRVYDLWANMIKRAYTEYVDSSVATEWHSFRTFLNSIVDIPNYEAWERGDDVHLDKDIRVSGNKVYSLSTCMFVSAYENMSDASNRRWGNK